MTETSGTSHPARRPVPRPGVAVAPSVKVAAGRPVELPVRVTNHSAAPRVLAVAPLGVDPGWVTGPVRTDVLAPGESVDVLISIAPPAGTLPATYPVAVAAQAIDPATGRAPADEQATGLAETVLVVNPRTQVDVSVEPSELTAVTGRRFTVVVRNSGGATAQVRLTTEDPRNGRVRLRQRQVTVAPDGEVRLRARAAVRRPRMIGYGYRYGFAVTAHSQESTRIAQGALTQRTVIGPAGLKIVALFAVLAVWIAGAVVLIPALGSKISQSAEEQAAQADGPAADGAAGDGAGADGAGGDGAGGDGAGGDGAGDGAGGAGGADGQGIQLSGTIVGDAADGVTVTLDPRSLVDEEMQGRGIGVDQSRIDSDQPRLVSAFTNAAPPQARPAQREQTGSDGAYSFAGVSAPGYYLLTFAKAGYQTQRFVVNSASEAAKEPLEVKLVAGEGTLSGRVTGPDGKPYGGAAVTITDGTTSITTSSTSAGGSGEIGSWRVTGLSTPSTYVVAATAHDMSTEARTITLAATGSGTADLKLASGVALVRGRTKAFDRGGHPRPIGGVTVSIDAGDDTALTATSLTEGDTGMFFVPGVPAPGTYTATLSAEGYQPVSQQVVLRRGDSELRLGTVLLSTSTGTVTGRVGGQPDAASAASTRTAAVAHSAKRAKKRRAGAGDTPLAATGLTLSNNDHTYKTTSTTPADEGLPSTFRMEGIVPGVYTLSADYFGYEAWRRVVRVTAGPARDDTVVSMSPAVGGGQPSTATVTGSAVSTGNAADGTDLTCTEACLTATLTAPAPTAADPDATRTYTDTFPADGAYVLPSPGERCPTPSDAEAACGLVAGTYTVTVSTPGFVTQRVQVEAAEATRTTAPVAELVPVPALEGTLTLAPVDGAPNTAPIPKTCVWVETTGTATINHTPDECLTAIERGRIVAGGGSTSDPQDDPTACTAGGHRNRGTEADRRAWCAALVDGASTYRIEVPTEGAYTITVVPTDHEYVAPSPAPVLDLRRGVQRLATQLQRLGRLVVNVKRPAAFPDDPPPAATDPTDVLVPASGVTVTVEPAPLSARSGVSDDNGTAVLTGLPADTYTVRGVGPTTSGSVTVNNVAPNTTRTIELPLTDPITSLVGRVHGTLRGVDGDVTDARVVLDGASSFAGDGTGATYDTADPTTNADGCFGVRIRVEAPRYDDCPTAWSSESRKTASFVTSTMRSITVSKVGWETRTFRKHVLDPGAVNDLELFPALLDVDFPVTTLPTDTVLDGDDVTGVVTDPTGRRVTAGVTTDGGVARLSWVDAGRYPDDTAAAAGGKAVPGTYSVTLTADGFAPTTRTVTCPLATATVTRCSISSPIVMARLATVKMTVLGGDGDLPVAGAQVTPTLVGTSIPHQTATSGSDGVATMGDIVAGTDTRYVFEVKAPGHKTGTTSLSPEPTDDVRLSCTVPPGNDRTRVTVAPTATVACTVTVKPLGVVQGSLLAVYDQQGASVEHTEALVGRRVTATRCAETVAGGEWCKRLGDQQFSAVTDDQGRFAVHGTLSQPGLAAGQWVLTAPTAAGFRPRTPPAALTDALPGTLVTVADGAVTRADVLHYAIPTDLTVEVTDGFKPLRNATVTLVRDPDDPDEVPVTLQPTGTGDDLVHSTTDLVPGYWWIEVDGAGLEVTPAQSVYVVPGSTGTRARVVVARVRGTVTGTVTENGTPLLVPNARVTLTCSDVDSGLCPTDGPALSASRDPLTTTSGVDGTYRLEGVVNGEYTISLSASGYAAPADATLTMVNGAAVTRDFPLTAATRVLTAEVVAALASDDVTGTELTLTPAGQTPGSLITVDLDGTAARVAGTEASLRWGCYTVRLVEAEGHHGRITGPAVTVGGAAPPDDATLRCPEGSLKVPRSGTAAIALSWTSNAVRLDYDYTVSDFAPEGTTLRVQRDGGGPAITVDDPAASPAIYVEPGDYTVTPVLPAADAPWFDVVSATGTAGEDTFAVSATEKLATVTVHVEGLVADETGRVTVSAPDGQRHPAPSGSPYPVTLAASSVTLQLPRGPWLFEGTWLHGPDAKVVTITSLDAIDVYLEADPDSYPPAGPRPGPASSTPDDAPSAPPPPTSPTTDAVPTTEPTP